VYLSRVRAVVAALTIVLVLAAPASAKFDLSLRLSKDEPRIGERIRVELRADAHVGECRMQLVAVAPGADPNRAVEAFVNRWPTRPSARLGFLVTTTRTGPGTWQARIRFRRAGRWHLIVPNWCAPGVASPRPVERVVRVRA
jgi:hypothetical protein